MIKRLFLSLSLVALMFVGVFSAAPVFATNTLNKDACSGADAQAKAALGCDQGKQAPAVAQIFINAAISVVGVIAVFMIIVAGQRYITSKGDPGQIEQSKTMIIYSVVALIIALLAFAIVNWILGGLFQSS